MKKTTLQVVVEALASYELDEPHDDNDLILDDVKWEQIQKGLTEPHMHNMSVTCGRCLAESWMNKAQYIASRLEANKHAIS